MIGKLDSVPGVLLFWLLFLSAAYAANVGPVLPVADGAGNQQNPAVVALPDRNLFFVAWEDWANPLDSEIKGAFLGLEEAPYGEEECLSRGLLWREGRCFRGLRVCGSVLQISALSGNQLSPAVAYSPDHGKIIVVWKDEGLWNEEEGWLGLFFRAVTPPASCENSAGPVLHEIQPVPYAPVFGCTKCTGTCSCRKNFDHEELCAEAGYFFADENCYKRIGNEETETDCNNAGGHWSQSDNVCYHDPVSEMALCAELRGKGFFWDEDGDTCFQERDVPFVLPDDCSEDPVWEEGELANVYPPYPGCNADDVCGENGVEGGLCGELGPGWGSTAEDDDRIAPRPVGVERLLLRERPAVAYNPRDRAFWFAWVEVRSDRNRARFLSCTEEDWTFGGGVFPAYAKLDVHTVNDWDNLRNRWEKVDILRNEGGSGEQMARILELSQTEKGWRVVYEFFTEVEDATITPDLRNGGIYLLFTGRRYEGTLEVDCEKGVSTFTEEETPAGRMVFGIFDRRIPEALPARLISENAPAFHPQARFDPLFGRILVVWEDVRDSGGAFPKVYGQMVEGAAGSLYLSNFPLTTPQLVGEEIWPLLKQTHPFIEWDPVNQRFFVVWQDNRAGAVSVENIDIWGQFVDPDGSLRGENLLVSATEEGEPTSGNQLAPKIAHLPALGVYLAVWKDARHYATRGADIYAQAFAVGQPQLALLDGEKKPLYPAVLDFGILTAGQRTSRTFYLRNTGDVPLRLCELSPLEGDFSYLLLPQILSDGDESSCLELQPGLEVEVIVEFGPRQEGAYSQSIRITSNAGEKTLLLQGATRPVISANRTVFDFGEVIEGTARSLSFTLVNHSGEEVEIRGVSLSGGVFSLEGIKEGSVIPAGGALEGWIVFRPERPGNYSGEVIFAFSLGGDITFRLSGLGQANPLSLEPEELNFGALRVGTTRTMLLTIRNGTDGTFILNDIGGLSSPFRVEGHPSGAVLPPGGSLNISVTFAPTTKGLYRQEIRLLFDSDRSGTLELAYSVRGQALAFPACVYNGLPERVLIPPGESPLWFVLVTGGEDLILSRFQEPGVVGFEPLINEPGNYLYALWPPEGLEPFTYRDRLSLLFAGARQPVEVRTEIVLGSPAPGWEQCVPGLSLTANGHRALRFVNGALPPRLDLAVGLSWPCAPAGAERGSALLRVTAPDGAVYHYDLSLGFVPYVRRYAVTPPLDFSQTIRIPLPNHLPEGLWLFELELQAGGKRFYTQAAVVIIGKLPQGFCEVVDLAD